MPSLQLKTSEQSVWPPQSGPPLPLPISPPDSVREPSPALLHLLQLLRDHRDGKRLDPPCPWIKLDLTEADFIDLEDRLALSPRLKAYVDDKVRLDLDYLRGRAIIRMPSWLHEIFGGLVEKELSARLQDAARNSATPPNLARLINDVDHGGSPTIQLGSIGCHCPDECFKHLRASFPAVVIEVSYTQKRKDLPGLAYDYIIGSKGKIHVVLGLDIEYRGSKAASVSIWQPRFEQRDDGKRVLRVDETVSAQLFRDEAGSRCPGALSLQLKDFLPQQALIGVVDSDAAITITYDVLATLLERAKLQHESTLGGGLDDLSDSDFSVASRPAESPPEHMTSSDEGRLLRQEAIVESRQEAADTDYVPGR